LDPGRYDQSLFDLVVDNESITIAEQNKIIYEFLQNRRLLPL
jgi:hypothetical protein